MALAIHESFLCEFLILHLFAKDFFLENLLLYGIHFAWSVQTAVIVKLPLQCTGAENGR